MIAELVRDPGAVVSVRSASEDNGVPYSFARSIQHELVRAGIVTSMRGSRGGMRLAVDPREVTLLDIIEAVQGPVSLAACDGGSGECPCPNLATCQLSSVWKGARQVLSAYFSRITLDEAVNGPAPVASGLNAVAPAEVEELPGSSSASEGMGPASGNEPAKHERRHAMAKQAGAAIARGRTGRAGKAKGASRRPVAQS